jgi:hypothetical protein
MIDTLEIPADLIPDVRMGLFGLLGNATEDISTVLTRPRFELHPEWFVPGRELFEQTCELLDVLGWDGNLRAQRATLDFGRWGAALKAALEGILPLIEMELAEVEENDAARAARRSSAACARCASSRRSSRSDPGAELERANSVRAVRGTGTRSSIPRRLGHRPRQHRQTPEAAVEVVLEVPASTMGKPTPQRRANDLSAICDSHAPRPDLNS